MGNELALIREDSIAQALGRTGVILIPLHFSSRYIDPSTTSCELLKRPSLLHDEDSLQTV